jgi:iron complex outermembrane receptor protein
MTKNVRAILIALFVVVCAAGPVLAQTARSLTGHITDAQGAAVPGAVVTLYPRETNARTTTVTDGGGSYRFERLLPGDYVIEVSANGFGKTSRTTRIERESAATLDINLDAAGPSETVLVTAAGTAQTVDEVSKAVTVVSAQEIDRRDENSISDALRAVPGLRIQQLGGPGTFARIQTRGLRDSDTAVLVDGLRLRDAGGTQGDATSFIEELFVVNPDRVEVLRGSGSSLYGSNAIGGAVNIISDQGGAPTHGQLQLEGGQLGLFHGRGQIAGGFDQNRFVYSGGLSLLKVAHPFNGDGNRNLSGQGFVQYNFSPTISVSGRIFGNDAYLQQTDSPFAPPTGVVLPPAGSIVQAIALPLDQQRRLEAKQSITPGNSNFVPNLIDPDNRRDSNFLSIAVTFNQRLNESFGYRASYQRLNTNRKFSDGVLGVRFEPAFNTFSDFDGRIDTFNLQADGALGRHNLLTGGYEFEREQYIGDNLDENPNLTLRVNAGTHVTQLSNTFFVQDQFRALENHFQAAAAFRVQSFSVDQPTFFGGTSVYLGKQFAAPKAAVTGDGAVSYFFKSTGTKLRAHVGSGYRAPSAFERLGSSFFNGVFSPFGDPGLRPERSVAVDGGIDQRLAKDRVLLSATYFYTRLQEVILFDSTGFLKPATDPFGRSSGYRNTGGGLARGVELSANAKATRTLDLTASYTFTNAVNRVASSVVGFLRTFTQPRHTFTFTVSQRIGGRTDIVFDMFAYGSYYAPFSGRAFRFSGPVKADLGASYTLPLNEKVSLRIIGKVDNLFDREYFENGFRSPGARFTGGGSLRF